MRLTSLAFADKLPVPPKYTCNGQNISPPFEFIDVPKDTTSFVLVAVDEDSSDDRVHWLVYNIPGNVTHFDEGDVPEGAVEGMNAHGSQGYEGPCAKYFSGVHRFRFTLFALDISLDLPLNATFEDVQKAMFGHILGSGSLVGIADGEMA